MGLIRPMEKGESLVEYSKNANREIFAGKKRDNGLPYFEDHLVPGANILENILVSSDYKEPGIAADYWHDTPEDVKGFDVINPFIPFYKTFIDNLRGKGLRQKGITYLNDLVKEAGDQGKYMCFIDERVTHRKGVPYQDYIYGIFSFPKGELIYLLKKDVIRALCILSELLKMADRRINIFPDEEIYTDDLVKEYLMLYGADKETLERFYKRTNTIDAFIVRGELRTGIDEELFDLTLRDLFKIRKRAMAGDNLYQYLPLAEDRLLIKTGERNGSFNLSFAENNGLFDWHRVRQMLKDTYLDSLKWHPGIFYEVGRMGLNKGAPRIKGYTPILKEIRNEWLEVKHGL